MRELRVYLVAGIVALFLLTAVVYYAQQRVGLVAVIRIKGYILTSDTADYYHSLIRSASENGRVRAVVVVIDSFGGYSNYVEQLYLSLKHLNERKPVVALAVNALSGGYYICAAASYIFAHSTSFVGAVGVISTAPPLLVPSEVVLETGPYKHTGFSRLLFFSNLSHALDAFLSAIEEGRGSRLKASKDELSRGLVYLGTEALKLGLVDEIGTFDQALEKAVQRAGLAIYRVVELNEEGGAQKSVYSWSNLTVNLLESLHPPPAIYYAYVPAPTLAREQPLQQAGPSTGGGKVVVDLSHGNMVSWWSLDALLAELAQRNVTAGFIDTWSGVEEELRNATCLVVGAPAKPYSEAEGRRVEEFVKNGGVLLLLFDPSYEYLGTQGLLNFVVAPINSLASRFGITFAYGFLYSEDDYYGIYRNVYARKFANSTLFEGVKELVFFTAAPVRSRYAVAWTPNTTYSSAAEAEGEYAVVALARVGNGTVVAVGDITVFSEPYCRVADNSVFISNLAELIANVMKTLQAHARSELTLERPSLPVGTVKVYEARDDGMVYEVKWVKVSENEVFVEYPTHTVRYYYGERGSLRGWEADGTSCVYDNPLPEPPFPLRNGDSWSYSTNFTLADSSGRYRGWLEGFERVAGFERVKALDGREYFCAKIEVRVAESIIYGEYRFTSVREGYYLLSSETGTVKQEISVAQGYDTEVLRMSRKSLILKQVLKPGS